MRRLITTIAGITGVVLWAYLVTLGAGQLANQPVEYDMEDLEVPDLDELRLPEAGAILPDASPALQSTTAQAVRPVRAIEPEIFGYPAFAAASDLERIEARTPMQVATRPTATVIVLHRPASPEAGILAFGEQQRIRLRDVSATDAERICRGSAGGTWPCGEMAKTQQRQFIRNRSVTCEAEASEWQGEIISRCWIGAQEVSVWLARHGWVEAREGSSLSNFTKMARAERRGLFGDAAP